jgi:hypothetical protein
MKNDLVGFREAASFIAGVLIGLSIVITVSAMMVTDPDEWQTSWVACAPISLALGLTLQSMITTKPRRRRVSDRPSWRVLPRSIP